MSRTISIAPVLKDIDVNAPPAKAFEVFAGFRWWPKTYSILPSKSPQAAMIVEPKVGGRWFERGEDGSECDVGKVVVWEPPKRMVLTWLLDSTFQINPKVVTKVEVTFTAIGADKTHVSLEHRLFDRYGEEGEKVRAIVDSPDGWPGLLRIFAEAVTA